MVNPKGKAHGHSDSARARKRKDKPMGYMLETRGLTKRFGRGDQAQDAVADVSLHIREGEVYGLLGPNGAGKSTTLKMICGMLRPTAGEILFAGHAWRREDLYAIGSLIEEAPLYPNLTARENLRVRTTLLGLPESRVDEVLAAVDLADTGKKRAGRFSMGMRQRLGLALALIARPRLLVLDEPTNGLDPIGIEELRDQIRGFAAAGTTVIVSSHILSEVQQMADTIGIIYGELTAPFDSDRVQAVRALFADTGIHFRVTEHIREEIWSKFRLNVCNNLPQAILGAGVGCYRDSVHMKAISDGLRRELEAIATARGIDLRIADAVSHGCAVPATARYSTLQDLDAGRHTEIDMFSGALMRMGKELGIPTPYNEYTYHMIKAMEEKNDGLFDYDGTEEPTWAK